MQTIRILALVLALVGISRAAQPTIDTQPASSTNCPGTTATFTVAASSDSSTNYQWYFNETNAVVDATNASYAIVGVAAINAGGYSVVVTNNDGAVTSIVATLVVTPAPSVTVNGATTVCPGTSVILDAITDAASPAYLWAPGGATTASITNAPGTTTIYTVRVTDGVSGCTNSGSATITVNTLTTASAIGNANNCPATPVTFTTTASGTGPFSYVWRKAGVLVQGPDGNNSYTIASVGAGDAASYSVEVTGLCNSVTNSGTLVVVGLPTITAQPASASAPMGNGISFSVTATTVAPGVLSYQWQTNGVEVTGATSSSLAISNLTLAQSGTQVRVAVSNCAGVTLSSIATLTVTPVTGISFDFNTPGQWTNTPFNLTGNNWMESVVNSGGFNNPFITGVPFEVSTGGVGVATGGGALDLAHNNGTDRGMTLLPVNFDFSLPGQTLIASIMTKVKIPTAAQRAIQVAFITTTNVNNAWQQVQANNGQGFMSAIFQSSAPLGTTTPSFQLRSQTKVIAGTTPTEQIPVNSPTNTLLTNRWYRFTAKFVNVKGVTADSYTVESSVQDMGADGETPGATVLGMAPITVANADIVNFKNLLLCIRGFENGGQDYWDNIHVATRTGAAAFVSNPESQTILENRTATFRALVDGDGIYTYQWNSNGVPIAGAGSWNYTTPPLGAAASGVQYTVSVTTGAGTITSGAAVVTVTPDDLDVLSVGSVEGSIIGLRFDQAVDKVSAETAANYTINGVPAVTAQLRDNNGQKLRTNAVEVLLTPATPVSGAFTVVVANVTSLSGNTVGTNNTSIGQVMGLAGFDVDPITQINGQAATIPGYNYSFAPGQIEVAGGGHDIFGNFDGFRFVYRQVAGDFDIKVRVPHLDLLRTPNKGGFDARVSLDAFSPHVGTYANPMLPGRNFIEGGVRSVWNQATTSWGNQPVNSYPNVWLRFRRSGNTFIRYSSSNGVNWSCDGQTTPSIAFPETLYVGFAVSANVGGTTVQQLVTAQFDSYGDFPGYAGATINLVQNPANATVNAGASADLTSVATVSGGGIPASAGELSFHWQRDDGLGGWTNMPTAGTTNNTVNTGPLFITDSGAQFRVIVSAPGALSVTSTVATVTVNDTTAPTFVSVEAGNSSTLVVNFSELMNATALNPANYTVTNASGAVFLVDSVAFLNGDARAVVLTMAGALPGSTFTVVINGVQDLAGNALAANSGGSFTLLPAPATPIVVEHYGGLATTGDLTALTNNVKFLGGQPDFITFSNLFGVNAGGAFPAGPDQYGTKTYSYFVPPTTSQYRFWLRGDDFLRMFINTNISPATSTNPTGRIMAINMTANNANYTTGNSYISPVLNAGQAYYMEVLMKESTGGDGMALTIRQGTSATVPPQAETAGLNFFRYPAAVAPKIVSGLEFYLGFTGSDLPSLTNVLNSAQYAIGAPNFLAYGTVFGCSSNLGNTSLDNYFGRVFSYFTPPSSGNYKFYMRSDDSSQFLMNTNVTDSTNPAGAVVMGQLAAFTGNHTLVAQNVNLVGGQPYYIEGRWKEGAGGDGLFVAVRDQADGAPPNTESISPTMLSYPTNLTRITPSAVASILPLNPTITDGQRIIFTANGVAGGGLVWLKNGRIVQTGLSIYQTDPLTLADDGAVFSLVVSNNFSVYTATSTVTVLADTAAPTIVSAVASQHGNSVLVTFDEVLDPLTAGCLANYTIPGLTVFAVDLDELKRNRVSLRTSLQTPNTVYTLTVNGVRDASGVGNATVNEMKNFSAWGFGGLGAVYVEIFTNIPGGTVESLLQNPRYVDNLPDISYYTNAFVSGQYSAAPNGGNSLLDNYGVRISGRYMPPTNGLYQFFIRSDDGSMLFMNTNGPAAEDRVLIARNDSANPSAYNNGLGYGRVGANASPILSLTAGTPYYLEALGKEGGGGDYMVVMVRAVDSGTLQPVPPLTTPALNDQISGAFFSAPGNPDINQLVVASAPPTDLTVFENELVNLELVANAIPVSLTPYITYQWQRTNDGTGTFTNIPGASTALLSFYATLPDDEVHYRIRASIPGQTVFLTTLLHVEVDDVDPYLVSASAFEPINGKQMVGIAFDGPVDVGIATEYSSYYAIDEFNTAVLFSSAQFRPGFPNKLLLITEEGPLLGNFTLYCDYMKDTAASQNEGTGLTATGAVQRLDEQIVGTPGLIAAGGYNTNAPGLGFTELATPTDIFTATNGGFDISANGWDIWNNADGMLFAHREVTGNFDIKTRVQKFTGADQWSKAGLMARGSTNANSRNIIMQTTPRTTPIAGQLPNNFFGLQWRDTDGAASGSLNNNASNAPAYPNAWVRLQRSNSTFYGYFGTNGVDWTLHAFRDTSSNAGGAFPDTMQVGLATTSHDQTRGLANNAYVEYRDLYFPSPAVIINQPEPAFIEVGIHQSVTFSNLAATGDNVRYQWRLNGVAITDATNASLTLPNTAVGQSGIYTAAASTDGGGQISSNVVLSVTNVLPVANSDSLTTTQGVTLVFPSTDLTANDTDSELDPVGVLSVFHPHYLGTNFDGGPLSGATMYGSATTLMNGGSGDSGRLRITDGVASQAGSLILNEVTPGARVLAFNASFGLRIAEVSAEPADGFSFNFGNDLPNAATGTREAENGVTLTGFSFSIDSYRFMPYPAGGTANTSGMKIRYNNVDIAGVQISPAWNDVNYIPVSIRLDTAGNLTILVNGTNVFGNRTIAWTPQAGRFGLFARTGGQFQSHSIDDLNISYIAEDTALGGFVTVTNGVVAYTPPAVACGLDTFYYLASDGQVGGTNVGTVNVTIIGTNAPVLVSCVADQNLATGAGCAGTLPDLRGQLVVTDCGPLSIGQSPAPGTSLPLGPTVVTFSITNNAGFTTNCTATVTVVDTTAPVATCPANIIAEATGPSGAVVNFTASGSDNCSLSSLVANPVSGSTFALGVTVVTVTATDNSGNANACTFTVTVQDTTAPAINCPANIITACTSTNGAVVNYTVTSVDLVDPNPTLIVTPPSGSTFPQGTNLVTAITYDAAGNTNTCSFLVIVQDQTPAVLRITQVGTNVVVCWPQSCTSYVLEGTADLNAPISWTAVGLPVEAVGSDFCVTIPASDPKRFFRLLSQ